jgi:NADH dehydrogenase
MFMVTIVVVGGGYAGLHTVKAVRAESRKLGVPVRVILMDQADYHVKKVRLVQAAAVPTNLRVGYSEIFEADEAEFVQGRCLGVDAEAKEIRYADTDGSEQMLAYDRLVLTLGSIVRGVPEGADGIALLDEAHADRIRRTVEANLADAAGERDAARQAALCAVTVVGGGISGVETAAETAKAMKRHARAHGLPPALPCVTLVAGGPRIVPLMTDAAARKLASKLRRVGVRIVEGQHVTAASELEVELSDGRRLPSGCTVWTIGVKPNPAVRSFGLPVDASGRLLTDSWYRVAGCDTIYAIGDNARIVDTATGIEDGMTCREAMLQAPRLGRVLLADTLGRPTEPHRAPTRMQFCVDLGEGEGFAWKRHLGVDWTITGKLGGKMREFTWNVGSFMK